MDVFLDTSWSLHNVPTNSTSYRTLFDPSKTTQTHLPRYFDHLPQYLASQKPTYIDDLGDTESEKLGTLRDCKSTIIPSAVLPPVQRTTTSQPQPQSQSIHIQLIYQNKTFAFILYTPHLILCKASASHTRHILNLLSETFNISVSALKLPSTLLSDALQGYIETLLRPTTSTTTYENDVENDPLDAEKRAALLHAAIGNLRVTIQFSTRGPVAPSLKTAELNVPYDTVDALIRSSSLRSTTTTMTSSNSENRYSTADNNVSNQAGFMSKLAEHLFLQTGLKLPLTGRVFVGPAAEGRGEEEEDDNDDSVREDSAMELESRSDAPLKVSRLACAAFAVSVEGKLKFASRSVESAIDNADLVVRANLGVLNDVVAEARMQGSKDGQR